MRRGAVRAPGWLLLVSGALALGLVWWVQHVRGVMPCGLCLWERWPWRAVGVLGALSALMASPAIAWIAVPALLAAIGLSVLHLGVEWHLWPSPLPECLAPVFRAGSCSERLASMPARPAKPCDAPSYLFDWLPLSLSALDGLAALTVLILLVGALRSRAVSNRRTGWRRTARRR